MHITWSICGATSMHQEHQLMLFWQVGSEISVLSLWPDKNTYAYLNMSMIISMDLHIPQILKQQYRTQP